MKLRNLMYATMIACAFASCSKDEDPVINPDGGDAEANATLEVQVLNTQSKAGTDVATAENQVNSLTLVVFNPNPSNTIEFIVEAIGTAVGSTPDNENGKQSVKTTITPGVKKVLVLANVPANSEIAKGKTFDQVLAATQTFSNETKANGFSMSSQVFDLTIVPSKVNYLGYGTSGAAEGEYLTAAGTGAVKLYRNVAKVQLNSLSFSIKNAGQYPSASVTPKRVFVLHAKKNTKLATVEQWGATESGTDLLIGAEATEYSNTWVDFMETENALGNKKAAIYKYILDNSPMYSTDEAYTQEWTTLYVKSANDKAAPFYVYENSAIDGKDELATLLVVEATFSFTDPNKEGVDKTVSYDRFYPVAVGITSPDFTAIANDPNFAGRTHQGVMRNLAYYINLTITGPGYETPFGPKPDDPTGGDTFLDAKVEVVPFGVVSQDGEVE